MIKREIIRLHNIDAVNIDKAQKCMETIQDGPNKSMADKKTKGLEKAIYVAWGRMQAYATVLNLFKSRRQ